MRVFVTGASGWIGSAVVPELINAGHEVIGLARSDASATALTAAGAQSRAGSLADLDVLTEAAAESDGVIHLAFRHDIAFTGDYAGAAASDLAAIAAFGAALAGSDKPLVMTSGTAILAAGTLGTEESEPDPHSAGAGRIASERTALSFAGDGVRSIAIRLPPTNHGDGDNGFMATLVSTARSTGVSGFIGDGTNRWPAVHRLDTAHLFRLALEEAPSGSVLHAVAEEGVQIRDVAAVIGRHLDLPVASVAAEDAGAHFSWLAGFLALDVPASSALTRDRMAWHPTRAGLLADLDEGHYFRATGN